MISRWKQFLLTKTGEWMLPRAGEWNVLFHNNYHTHHSNITLLWFHNRDEYPSVVTKLFREPQIPEREFTNLTNAYRLAPDWVPKPLHCAVDAGFWTLWMQGVPGARFWNFSKERLRDAAEMVTSIHEAMRQGAARPEPQRYDRIVATPLETLARFGDAPSVQRGCAELAAIASRDWLYTQTVIPQHGDLFLDNVLFDRKSWHVIDWETFGVIDLPFYDLLTLLISRLSANAETPQDWDSGLTAQFPDLVRRYASRLNLPVTDMRLALPLTLANWFHLQWSDGRTAFTSRMYGLIRHYFEHTSTWQRAFVPRQ